MDGWTIITVAIALWVTLVVVVAVTGVTILGDWIYQELRVRRMMRDADREMEAMGYMPYKAKH